MSVARQSISPDLMRLSDKEFEDIVNQDLRDRPDEETGLGWGDQNPELKMALRSPEVVKRWYTTLLGMQKSLEGFLGARRADLQVKADSPSYQHQRMKYQSWRGTALRVKIHIELRLLEARTLLDQYGDSHISNQVKLERNSALARVGVLENAISRHHQSFPVEDEPSDYDLELWSYVKRETGNGIAEE